MSKKKEWSVDNRWGLDECLGLDKYKLTSEQRNECISLWNHFGEGAALDQAKKFYEKNIKGRRKNGLPSAER